MKKIVRKTLILAIGLSSYSTMAQDFKVVKENRIEVTPVKDQNKTGTCWAFSTTSFIEAELIRQNRGEYDLSEMFFVRYAYLNKAQRYMRYHGVANFSQGGQAHDVMNVLQQYGMVTEEAYSGINYQATKHDHSEMAAMLKGALNGVAKGKLRRISSNWKLGFSAILDAYLGQIPSEFTVAGKEYSPISFKNKLKFDADDYIELTSYSCYPFYEKVNLEVPDNWSGDLYYNLPANELMEVMKHALKNGYTICWDGDVSEREFKHGKGFAKLNDNVKPSNYDSTRQETFDNWSTTDDHLMHITGTSEDEGGALYFITKNSWDSDSNKFGGYLHMSEDFVAIKTVAIMIHKDALPKAIAKKLIK